VNRPILDGPHSDNPVQAVAVGGECTIGIRYSRPMNGPSYFEIQVDASGRAINFYRGVFGWNFTKAEGLPIEYWRIETDGPRRGLLKRPAAAPPPGSGINAFTCSIAVKNFDETGQRIQDLGGKIALPKFAIPGTCWQGYFLDTEGNVFGIFQVDKAAK
jgi:predicted enzyme related to lactoylglutathione lyase